MILRIAAAIGAFILTLDAAALIVAFGMASPDAPGWVGTMLLAAVASGAVVIGCGAAVYAWRYIATDPEQGGGS